MKTKYLIGILAFVFLSTTGCQESAETRPVVYMSDAQSTPAKVITIDTPPETAELTVSSSVPASTDTYVELELRPDLVAEYNAKYHKNYSAPPAGSYALSSKTAMISQGFTSSSPVEFEISSVDDFEEGTTYCMPIRIKDVGVQFELLEASRTLYVVLKTPVISKAIYIGSSNKYKVPSFKESEYTALNEITLECRVYANAWRTTDPYISSIMGIEGECCLRFGDVKVDNNVLQILHGNYQPAATNNPFQTGKWYHVAGVWNSTSWSIYIDGQYITGSVHAGETISLSTADSWGFGLGAGSGYNSNRPLDGYIAEARVWTRALSTVEIANNMNYVNPQSPGLLAYWRMNAWEPKTGGGNIVRDLTGNGFDAEGGSSNPTMIDTRWL